MPAIVDRSPLLVAISTSGASPVLARMARAAVERALPERLGELARWAARHRERVAERVPSVPSRRELWERVLEGPIGQRVLAGRVSEADQALERVLQGDHVPGEEVIVVVDPAGDPERLTLGALRALGRAGCVLVAPGASEATLRLARRDAPRGRLEGTLAHDLRALAAHARERAREAGLVCVVVPEGDETARLIEAVSVEGGDLKVVLPGK